MMRRRRIRRQEGQALIAALVTMTLLFSIAGGLAVAVSAGLSSQGPSTATYLRDAAAVSSTSAVASLVAGRDGACPSGTLFGDVKAASYSCNPVDLIAPSKLTPVPLSWSGGCAVQQIAAAGHVTAWLNYRGQAMSSMYIDSSASGCSPPGGGPCVAAAQAGGAASFLLIKDCPMPASGQAYLHVSGSSRAARVARFATLASFLPGQTITAPVVGPIVAAGLRGPGNPLDLAVAGRDTGGGFVAVYRGNGDGTFAGSPIKKYTGFDITALTVADLTGRGYAADIAAISFWSNSVTVLVSAGSGFTTSTIQLPWSNQNGIPPGATSLAAGQFVGSNGNTDLMVGNIIDRTVTVLPGAGNGAFGSPLVCSVNGAPAAMTVLPGQYLAVASADQLTVYNRGNRDSCRGDGDNDSNGDNNGNGDNNNGNGNGKNKNKNKYLQQVGSSYQLDDAAGAMALGLFNAGSNPDLAITIPNRQEVQILFGQPSGRFSGGRKVPVSGMPTGLTAANFGSGTSGDLAVTTINGPAGDSVTPYLRSTGFQPMLGGDLAVGSGPAGVTSGDFQGLGSDDMAVASFGAKSVQILLRNRSKVFSIVGGASDGSAYNEADVVWQQTTKTNSLWFEGGLG